MTNRRIVFDASAIQGGGGFTFVARVVPALASVFPKHSFRTYLRNPRLAAALPARANLEVVELRAPNLLERARFTYVELRREARAWRADLVFSLGDYAPIFTHCPVVASSQNPNIALRWPELRAIWGPRQIVRLRLLRLLAQLTGKTVAAVHYVSADSATVMGDALHVPARKRCFTHHGIDPAPWRASSPRPHPRPYLLSVSSVYPYKNYVRLIQAWRALAERRPATPDLVIVGDNQDAGCYAQMEAARAAAGALATRVTFVGEVAHSEMPQWYANAELFVFPSYLETFGIPLLEAMAARIPLVAADLGVFREIAGDAAVYADPFDAMEISRAIERVFFEPGLREQLVERGSRRVERFTWERTARDLMRIFEDVIETDAPRPAPSATS